MAILRAVLLAAIVCLPGPKAHAQADAQVLEYRVKAAYLLNFSRYVTWPPDAFATPDAPIRICVVGENPFRGLLEETVAGQRTQGRKVQALRVSTPELAVNAGCNIVYIGRSHRGRGRWQQQLRGRPIVTVGEGEEFLDEGGMLGFVLTQETVRFAASLPALHAGRLQVSSRVLNLATRVIADRGQT